MIIIAFILIIDINECSDSNLHNCTNDQVCQNTVGSFKCTCREGFVFKSDGSTCECKNNIHTSLLLLRPIHTALVEL